MLDLAEEPLDEVALLVDMLVVGDGLRSRCYRWNDSLGLGGIDGRAGTVAVVAFVGEELVEVEPLDQGLRLLAVVDVPARQDEAQRIAESVDDDVDLRARATARTPNLLRIAPPFAPAACWCARTMVASMMRYS